MNKYLQKIAGVVKARIGIDSLQKQMAYQAAITHLGLPEILPINKEVQSLAKKKLQEDYEIGDFHTAIHKNDMMFNFRLYHHSGHIFQTLYGYYVVGANLLRNLHGIAQKHELSSTSILDFGAGHGRISRFWPQYFKTAQISVSEIKQQALEFQKEYFGFRTVLHTSDPKSFPTSGKFDLILAVSVFTHLPKELFEAWLEKLQERLNPRGVVIFTFNDPQSEANKKLLGRFSQKDFHYLKNSEEVLFPFISDSNTKLEEYGHSFISKGFLQKKAADLNLEIVFLENEMTPSQEAVLLRKRDKKEPV